MTGELAEKLANKKLAKFPRQVTFSAKRLFCAHVASFARS
jgi:hypothetical protein